MAIDWQAQQRLQRGRERFHHLAAPPNQWLIVRLDGRGFAHLPVAAEPRQAALHVAATALLQQLQGHYAAIHSDEISVLFLPGWQLFDRGVEKLVSVSAGLVSAEFSLALGRSAHFDSRLWLGESSEAVLDYFCWRQADTRRSVADSGTGLYWRLEKHTGIDPRSGTTTETHRRRLVPLEPLPATSAYAQWLAGMLAAANT